jgi:hypothetical protein
MDFVVSIPVFDWQVLCAISVSFLLLAVGLASYDKVRSIINGEGTDASFHKRLDSDKARVKGGL